MIKHTSHAISLNGIRRKQTSAQVGCIPMALSKSAFVAPSFRPIVQPWVISPAWGPRTWNPTTLSWNQPFNPRFQSSRIYTYRVKGVNSQTHCPRELLPINFKGITYIHGSLFIRRTHLQWYNTDDLCVADIVAIMRNSPFKRSIIGMIDLTQNTQTKRIPNTS